jgi:Lipoprotein LpqB beta-propeller domain/Sporulation and spore germination
VARRRLLGGVVVAVAAAVLASGCANIPSDGRPTEVTGISQQGQFNLQPVPPVPHPGMSENDIVQGFIAASASFTNGHAAGRAFLDDHLQSSWRPSWAASVVNGLTAHSTSSGPVTMNGQSTLVGTVTVTAHQVATISDYGRYVTTPASTVYKFHLARVNKQWRITSLPSLSILLLTQYDFQEVYQPRNLYVWTPDHKALLPEPVFAPQVGTSTSATSVAEKLVRGLLANQGKSSWLGPDTRSQVRGVTLRDVDVDGQTATVNLGGAAARDNSYQFARLAAQVVVTLTSTSYNQPAVAGYVTLEINGKVQSIDHHSVIGRSRYRDLVPNPPSGLPLYFIGRSGLVTELRSGTAPQPIQKPLAIGQHPYSLIAISAGSRPQFAGAITTNRSCDIYYGSLTRLGSLQRLAIPIPHSGPCTSLSWDSHGNIWAVTSQSAVWLIPAGSRQPMELPLAPLANGGPSTYKVLSLSVAPDGVRAAMVIKWRTSRKVNRKVEWTTHQEVVLAAVGGSGTSAAFSSAITIGAGLSFPVAASWFDAYHVMVLAQDQLWDVPVNGGTPIPAGSAPGTTVMTATGPRQVATAGNGQILTSSGPDQSQQLAARGTDPTYPG